MIYKTIFIVNPHSIVDVITNSSTELYVFDGKEIEIIKDIIENIYPEYLSEYESLKDINDMSIEELDSFLQYHLRRKGHYWNNSVIFDNREDYPQLSGFHFDELYDTSKTLGRGEEYELINNLPLEEREYEWDGSFVTEKNKEKVKQGIIKDVGRFFLYSVDENPNWKMQEQLMNIGTRYHLG